MKKLSIALLLTASQVLQAVNPQAFTDAVKAAKANRSDANIEKVLSTLDQLTAGGRKPSSAQRQRLQELGLGDYADASPRVELYRSRTATRGPISGPAAGAPVAPVALDAKLIDLGSQVKLLQGRTLALSDFVKTAAGYSGIPNEIKSKFISDINVLDAEARRLLTSVRTESTSTKNSLETQQSYKDLVNEVQGIISDLANLKNEANRIKSVADDSQAGKNTVKDIVVAQLDKQIAELEAASKLPELSYEYEFLPVPPVIPADSEGAIVIYEAPKAPRDLKPIIEDLKETKEQIKKDILPAATEEMFFDLVMKAAERKKLAQEAQAKKEELEAAAIEDKQKVSAEEAEIIAAMYKELRDELVEYKAKLDKEGDSAPAFESAKQRFDGVYNGLIAQLKAQMPEEERAVSLQDALDAYNDAVSAYNKYVHEALLSKKGEIIRSFSSYDKELANMAKQLASKKADLPAFKTAYDEFQKLYPALQRDPENESVRGQLLAANEKANQAYYDYLQGQKAPAGEETAQTRYDNLVRELRSYVGALDDLTASAAYTNLNDTDYRKTRIAADRKTLNDRVTRLKNQMSKIVGGDESEWQYIVGGAKDAVKRIHNEINRLSSENRLAPNENLINILRATYYKFVPGAQSKPGYVVEFPGELLPPIAPDISGLNPKPKPSNGGGSRPASVKTPLENAVERYNARIKDVASAEDVINELGDQELEGSLDPVNVQAVRKVISEKGIKVNQVAENALNNF